MIDPPPWLKLYVLPAAMAGLVIATVLMEMWAVAAIGTIILANGLFVWRSEYRRGGRPGSWRERWSSPTRLGIALLSWGAMAGAAVLAFGFTIGVVAVMVLWIVALALWLRALLQRPQGSGSEQS